MAAKILVLFSLIITPYFLYSQKGKGGGASTSASSPSGTTTSTPSATVNPSSPYILAFDGKSSNLQGIPFDAPVQLQFYINDKIDINGVGYLAVTTHYYKKKLNGVYKSFPEYFRNILPVFKINSVPRNANDTLTSNSDPTGLKYILNISDPIFLKPNKHYVFGFFNSITDDKKYFPGVSDALNKFIIAHNSINLFNTSGLTTNEQALINDFRQNDLLNRRLSNIDSLKNSWKYYKLYVKSIEKAGRPEYVKRINWKNFKSIISNNLKQIKYRYDTSANSINRQIKNKSLYNKVTQQFLSDWQKIYTEDIISSPDGDKYFSVAINSYNRVYNSIQSENQIQTIPSNNYNYYYTPVANSIIPAENSFYQVYKLALDLAPMYNQFMNYSLNHDLSSTLNLEKYKCLVKLVENISICGNCFNNSFKDCGILKDTTGYLNFLVGMVKPDKQNIIKNYLDSVKKFLTDPSSFGKNNQNIVDSLNLIKNYFIILKNQILLNLASLPDECFTNLLINVENSINYFDDYIKQFILFQNQYITTIKINNAFMAFKFYSADTYTYSLTTRQPFKLTADIGVVNYGINSIFKKTYGNNWNRVTPYFGIHWNWRYVNTDIPFSSIPNDKFYSLRRFSIFLGITMISVQETGQISNLFGNSALLLGIGYKINNDGLRLVFGSMAVKKNNPNPLVINKEVGFLPFLGLSYDFNTIFTNMVSLIK